MNHFAASNPEFSDFSHEAIADALTPEPVEPSQMVPKISTVVLVGWLADQKDYAVNVTYPGEPTKRFHFVGSATGEGPVVMVMPNGYQTFVTNPRRFGEFSPEWVRRFFTD